MLKGRVKSDIKSRELIQMSIERGAKSNVKSRGANSFRSL